MPVAESRLSRTCAPKSPMSAASMLVTVLIDQTTCSDGHKVWLYTLDILCTNWLKDQEGCQAAKGDAHQPPSGDGAMGNLEIHTVPSLSQLALAGRCEVEILFLRSIGNLFATLNARSIQNRHDKSASKQNR